MSQAPKPQMYRLADLIDEGYAQAQAAYEARQNGVVNGPAICFSSKLSHELCGSLPIGMTVLHGPPGSGKSALAQQIAGDAGCPALITSFEMSPIELLRRAASRITSTYISKFRNGDMSPESWRSYMSHTVKALPNLCILDGTKSLVSVNDIREALCVIRGDSKHALLVIDSASSWVRCLASESSEYEAINQALSSLQNLASEMQISLLVVAEQNRANRNNDRQEAAAGSRVYEYGAEVMLALNRDQAAIADADGAVEVEMVIAKNRLGAQGRRIPLRFTGGFMRFEESETVASMARGKRAA